MGSAERLQVCFRLPNAFEANLAAEDNQSFKKRRRILAPADGDADGLKGLPGL